MVVISIAETTSKTGSGTQYALRAGTYMQQLCSEPVFCNKSCSCPVFYGPVYSSSGEIILDSMFGFEKVLFGDEFKNINYIKLYTDNDAFDIDNIYLNTEPAVEPVPAAV